MGRSTRVASMTPSRETIRRLVELGVATCCFRLLLNWLHLETKRLTKPPFLGSKSFVVCCSSCVVLVDLVLGSVGILTGVVVLELAVNASPCWILQHSTKMAQSAQRLQKEVGMVVVVGYG